MLTQQSLCDELFERHRSGRLTGEAYARAIDEALDDNPLPPPLRAHLDRRRDGRSVGEFALHVYRTTARERSIIREWAGLVEAWGFVVRDEGVANDGRLVLDPGAGTSSPDYVLVRDGVDRPLEVKFAPHPGCVTYKVGDLHNYIARDALVLTVIGAGGDRTWSLMDAPRMTKFLEVAEHGRHRGFGGKPTARLHADRFAAVFRRRRWRKVRPRVAPSPA